MAVDRIETGVDKLLKLVAEAGKVSTSQAAKKLCVGEDVVKEWANFLEDEKLVTLEFSLTKTWICKRRLTRPEVEAKRKEYDAKKEAFVRQVDASIAQIEQERQNLDAVKEKYASISQLLGGNLGSVHQDIAALQYFEDLKRELDAQLVEQRKEHDEMMRKMQAEIEQEERRYQQVLGEVNAEIARLQHESAELGEMEHEEQTLAKRIEALQQTVQAIAGRVSRETGDVNVHRGKIKRLQQLAEKLRVHIAEKKKRVLEPLVKIGQDQEARLLRMQEELVQHARERFAQVSKYEGMTAGIEGHLRDFLQKRARTEAALRQLQESERHMEHELSQLVLKAKSFDLARKEADANAHIVELEQKFREFKTEHATFADQIGHFRKLVAQETKAATS